MSVTERIDWLEEITKTIDIRVHKEGIQPSMPNIEADRYYLEYVVKGTSYIYLRRASFRIK